MSNAETASVLYEESTHKANLCPNKCAEFNFTIRLQLARYDEK